MQENTSSKTAGSNSCNLSSQRRKRINRIKQVIILILIILLIIPIIMCIVLGTRVIRLEAKVDRLLANQDNNVISSMEEDDKDIVLKTTKDEKDDIRSNHGYDLSNLILKGNNNIPSPEFNPTNGYIPEPYRELLRFLKDKQSIAPANDEESLVSSNDNNLHNEDKDNKDKNNEDKNNEDKDNDISNAHVIDKVPSDIIDDSDVVVDGNDTADDTENRDYSDNTEGKYIGKQVYLTFDDGPSSQTAKILDILEHFNVKATFFVIGKTDEESKLLYKRIVDEGHTLGMHSYSHDYGEIYKSVEDFDKDFTKLWKLLYDTTGYMPIIYRFPGGSSNLSKRSGKEDIIRYLNDKSITYYDWNALNGDATGVDYTMEQLIDNVLDGVATKNRAIVLMHDTSSKKATVEALPSLITELISEGAELLPIDDSVSPIQQIKASSID